MVSPFSVLPSLYYRLAPDHLYTFIEPNVLCCISIGHYKWQITLAKNESVGDSHENMSYFHLNLSYKSW